MVRITVDLIRKRSEHNEGEISTLEEISLHQENIEKIELIDKLCKHLKILLLQNNLINKIENLNKLKSLEYLNLAINNIELIENLNGLESLKKLDLTINFISDLRCIKNLLFNQQLEQLFLTGNPCTDYDDYRYYVIATLPQLNQLDMIDIKRSERIKALQQYGIIQSNIVKDFNHYSKYRDKQIFQQNQLKITEIDDDDVDTADEEEEDRKFWSSKSYHTPESRIAIAERISKINEKRNKVNCQDERQIKYTLKLFNPQGKPYNINQPKVSFTLNDESDPENVILEVETYRHLDTSLVDVDVQPWYIRVTIKGKILQLTLPCEISTEKSVASRNIITGNLIVTMPRLNSIPFVQNNDKVKKQLNKMKEEDNHDDEVDNRKEKLGPSKRELLEIGPTKNHLDFSQIYKDPKQLTEICGNDKRNSTSNNFIDNPDVPPLE